MYQYTQQDRKPNGPDTDQAAALVGADQPPVIQAEEETASDYFSPEASPKPSASYMHSQADTSMSRWRPQRQENGQNCASIERPPDKRASWKRDRLVTAILVNFSSIMERTDEQLLPAVYAFVGESFDARPSQLGYLTQSRALMQAIASPLGGFAGFYFNRIWVIAFGCTLWGVMTTLFSTCSTLYWAYLLWAINGIGLSLVIPNGQSLTADYFSEAARGRAFGALYLTGGLGAMFGEFYATSLGPVHVLGVEGWRFAFFSVAMLSLLIGLLNFLFARDPRCSRKWQVKQDNGEELTVKKVFWELGKMCSVPTFLIIIFQGILGSTPWNALVFLTLYMQTIGMSNGAVRMLVTIFLGGTALGGLLGGWLGDIAAKLFPNAGRIAICQLSVLAGVPLSVILFKMLPMNGETATVVLYAGLLGWMGLLISWAAPACNNPIFAEIVPPNLRTMIYAFDRSFESAIAASAAPLVGILAERFGWQGNASPFSDDSEPDLNRGNAIALGNALLLCTVVPWGLCFLIYTGLYTTYPRDREKALLAARDAEGTQAQAVFRSHHGRSRKFEQSKHDSLSDSERHRLLQMDSSMELTALHEQNNPQGDDLRVKLAPLDSERETLLYR